MKSIYGFLFFCFWTVGLLAQTGPVNDDCISAISLGTLPVCNDQVYTNVNADETILGNGDLPTCFNGNTTQNDVWFSFTTPAEGANITITVTGVGDGPNQRALTNPQFIVYQGGCNGLAEVGFCARAPNGEQSVELSFGGLEPATTYLLRINDYSPTAAPNWGDFTLCMEEGDIPVNMGDVSGSTSCRGTLYDSGGPDGPYSDLESRVFKICPDQPGSCIEIDVTEFAIEGFIPGGLPGLNGDRLIFFAGDGTGGPIIAQVTGFRTGSEPIRIQSPASCVTVAFFSDFFTTFDGFELKWRCLPECTASSPDNPVVISSVPFSGNFSTCDDASTFATSPCSLDLFLGGPEYVFVFDSPGNLCADISVSNAAEGTGILILNGPPGVDETLCIARSTRGSVPQADLKEAGRYYIVVANSNRCTDFTLNITPVECSISPSLRDALCNPLNGCVNEDGLPSVFLFEDGFQDMEITDANRGCWEGFGDEPDFVWFTIQAAQDGRFGFILQSGDNISDIDFNVWGPFTPTEVCETPNDVISYITNNQPIRSSYAPSDGGITGIADRHPQFGFAVTDVYDCGEIVGSGGDDFVSAIPVKKDEVYVVLMNDWGNEIEQGGILIDWSPSDLGVLGPLVPELITNLDTALCVGDSIQIQLENGINAIQWLNDTETLSCTDCLNPVAKPTQTTTYRALIDAVCYKDTVNVTVNVLALDLGPDLTVCRNAAFDIPGGPEFPNATFQWTVPDGLSLSCTDCARPTVTTSGPGQFTLQATLTGSNCTLTDELVITVLDKLAPQYTIADDQTVCLGDSVNIGGVQEAGSTFFWTSKPAGFDSPEPNPSVTPAIKTTYFLEISNSDCPLTTRDSVVIGVDIPPQIKLVNDTVACQGDTLVLGLNPAEDGVTYTWQTPGGSIENASPDQPIGISSAGQQTYTLIAERGACIIQGSVTVDVTEIAVQIEGLDTLLLCKGGEPELLSVQFAPANATVQWSPATGIEPTTGNVYAVNPPKTGVYTVQASNGNCVRFDSIYIAVDSLPLGLDILPADTTICQGETVILTSKNKAYEPRLYPNIKVLWTPDRGQETPDTLYNLVVTPDTTINYLRVTSNGACVDSSFALVNVTPIAEISVIPGDTSVCEGQSVNLQIDIPDGKKMEEIMWTPEAGLSCTDCENPRATPLSRTVYNVEGKIDDCPVSASANIDVIPGPRVNLIAGTTICIGSSIRLNTAADALTTYEWTSPNDPAFSSRDPLLTVSPTQETTYRLTARRGECDAFTGEVTIRVVPKATITINAPDEICFGDAASLSAQTNITGVGQNFTWLYNGRSVEGANVVLSDLTETSTITLVYENPCETIEENFVITVKNAVTITNMTVDPMEFEGEGVPLGSNVTLLAETNPANAAGATFQWTANGQPIPGNGPTATHVPTESPTEYTLTITSANGCTSSFSIQGNVIIPKFAVPNAFTPNGDSSNDFFNVVGTPGAVFDVVDFRVWNRWGQLVYNNENPTQGWNGEHNGKPAPSDVYVYKITIRLPNASELKFDGDVALIR